MPVFSRYRRRPTPPTQPHTQSPQPSRKGGGEDLGGRQTRRPASRAVLTRTRPRGTRLEEPTRTRQVRTPIGRHPRARLRQLHLHHQPTLCLPQVEGRDHPRGRGRTRKTRAPTPTPLSGQETLPRRVVRTSLRGDLCTEIRTSPRSLRAPHPNHTPQGRRIRPLRRGSLSVYIIQKRSPDTHRSPSTK